MKEERKERNGARPVSSGRGIESQSHGTQAFVATRGQHSGTKHRAVSTGMTSISCM